MKSIEPYLNDVWQGDCLEVMKKFPDNSIDAVVTDPPYGLSKEPDIKEVLTHWLAEETYKHKSGGFMGKKWDSFVPGPEYWRECCRVLKPGGHLLCFSGTRTYDLMAIAVRLAGFEVRDMLEWIYASGFPKSLSIGKAINKLETKEWSKISKALDNINQKSIMKVWKNNSNNVKIVETQSKKSQTEIGICMSKNGFAQENVVGNITQKNCDLLVSFAEQNLKEAQAINTKINTALKNVEAEIRQLQNNVKSAERQSQDQNLNQAMSIFTAPVNVKEWLNENTEVNHKVDEALKTLRGNKKYSNEEITSVLCAVIPSVLKHTILNQSKTFQNLDTTQKTECASAINVIITEYTAEHLISNTVDILKSKAVDKLQENERKVIGDNPNDRKKRNNNLANYGLQGGVGKGKITEGCSEWEGWGTALKPAVEPIIVARKPLSEKTVAKNVLKWGTGAINIDGCRIKAKDVVPKFTHRQEPSVNCYGCGMNGNNRTGEIDKTTGRFPANLIHDGSDEVVGLFPKSNGSGRTRKLNRSAKPEQVGWGMNKNNPDEVDLADAGSGSAARFFYCAKSSKSERNAGLDGMPKKRFADRKKDDGVGGNNPRNRSNIPKVNHHPTVKPLSLMRYLVRLVTPPNGIILDPFTGSGTTCIASVLEGFNYIGIELDIDNEGYIEIAKKRIKYWKENPPKKQKKKAQKKQTIKKPKDKNTLF